MNNVKVTTNGSVQVQSINQIKFGPHKYEKTSITIYPNDALSSIKTTCPSTGCVFELIKCFNEPNDTPRNYSFFLSIEAVIALLVIGLVLVSAGLIALGFFIYTICLQRNNNAKTKTAVTPMVQTSANRDKSNSLIVD